MSRLLLLFLLFTLPTSLVAEPRKSVRPVSIVLDENGLPIVSVTLHSLKTPGTSRAFRFILDTGADWCVVDKSVPSEFFWDDPHTESTARDIADQALPTESVLLKRVEVGDLTRDGIYAARMDLQAQMGRFQDQPVDGILGMTFLRGTRFLLEPDEHRLIWWGYHFSPGATLPLSTSPGSLPSLSIRMGDQTVEAEVDTGSTGGLDLPAALRPTRTGEKTVSQGVSGVAIAGEIQAIPTIEAGGYTWRHVPVDFQEGTKLGRIGLDVWLASKVCFDFVTRHVTLTLDKAGSLPLRREPNRRLPLLWDRSGAVPRLVVALVKPGSPMEKAGCRVGDVLLQAGSLKGQALTRRAVQDLVASGPRHGWIVLRSGKEVPLTFHAP